MVIDDLHDSKEGQGEGDDDDKGEQMEVRKSLRVQPWEPHEYVASICVCLPRCRQQNFLLT